MSEDFKAKFKAAAAQRGVPTAKDQLKAIRAQKAAAAAAAAPPSRPAAAARPAAAPASAAPAAQAPASKSGALPADFFEAPKKDATVAAVGPSGQTNAQRPGATAAPGAGPALPAGFFMDKEADAKARGVKLPTAADKEAEFRAFTANIDEELKNQAAEEAEVADFEAEEKADREAFLLRRQAERLQLLQRRKELLAARGAGMSDADAGPSSAQLPELPLDEELRVAPPPAFGSDDEEAGAADGQQGPGSSGAAGGAAGAGGRGEKSKGRPLVMPGKRRRVVDVLAETLGAGGDSDGSSGGDSEDEGVVPGGRGLDWRAKTL